MSPAQKAAATKKSRLTQKEAEFLKGVVSGKSGTQAALDAYNTTDPNTAGAIASENLQKPKIRDALAQAYENNGLTAQAIADALRDGLLAKKTIQNNGTLVETTLPDHSVRINAARTAAQLIGAGKQEDPDKPTINFNFGQKTYVNNS